MKPNHPSDYAEELATEIEHGPHWSQRPATVRPEVAAAPLPPRLPRAYQVSAAPLASRSVRVAPVAPVKVVSHAPPRPEPAPAVSVHAAARGGFYSYAESQAAEALATDRVAALPWGGETERVDPLPFGALRPDWIQWLDRAWSRFAAPILGGIAGLIFVVGYLAYSSQRGHTVAGAAASAEATPIVMPAEIAAAEPAESAPIAEPAPVTEPPPSLRAPTVTRVNAVKRAAPVKAKAKRGPIRLNDSTPLGDLRPSRSR